MLTAQSSYKDERVQGAELSLQNFNLYNFPVEMGSKMCRGRQTACCRFHHRLPLHIAAPDVRSNPSFAAIVVHGVLMQIFVPRETRGLKGFGVCSDPIGRLRLRRRYSCRSLLPVRSFGNTPMRGPQSISWELCHCRLSYFVCVSGRRRGSHVHDGVGCCHLHREGSVTSTPYCFEPPRGRSRCRTLL